MEAKEKSRECMISCNTLLLYTHMSADFPSRHWPLIRTNNVIDGLTKRAANAPVLGCSFDGNLL